MTLRLSEVYLSVQGEGPNVGVPTVFVRFAGCNLRCPGWPCDTPYAIDPANYRQEWTTHSVSDVVHLIKQAAHPVTRYNVCLTGGEPFLQNKTSLHELVDVLWSDDEVEIIECFSNGTFVYPEWANRRVSFVMDWKLPGSEEDPLNENRIINVKNPDFSYAVKFVCKDEYDFQVAKELYERYLADKPDIEVYYGVVWDAMKNSDLVDLVLRNGLPWRLNVQMHNYIFNRDDRGI